MSPSRTEAASRSPQAPRSARLGLDLLARIDRGTLAIGLPDGAQHVFGDGQPQATLDVADWSVFATALARGDIGFAEAYVDGHWDTPDLPALLTLLAQNRAALARALHGRWLALAADRLRHWCNANTRAGSRRNIMSHYDLGNEFYALWLDPTMSYSAALYGDAAVRRSLDEAQGAKYRRIIRRLGLQPGQRILEIGCGWGGFAETAIAEAGVHVTGITLSPAQLAYAQDRLQRAGLAASADLRLCDYRDLEGRYDHVVSIEMFEAVGERYWPQFFATLQRVLRPQGRALLQSITIRDDLFAAYRRQTDFIQQHVFPGGMLPSPSAFAAAARRRGFVVQDSFAFGADYARTLGEWTRRFRDAWPQIATLGFDERFRRLWLFYLGYCEAGFHSGSTDVRQFELTAAA